jgi:hypothetical protein
VEGVTNADWERGDHDRKGGGGGKPTVKSPQWKSSMTNFPEYDDGFPGASIAGRNRTDAEWERLFKSMRTPESGEYGRLIRLCEAKDSEFLGLMVEGRRRQGKLPKDPAEEEPPADCATEIVKAVKNARRVMMLSLLFSGEGDGNVRGRRQPGAIR